MADDNDDDEFAEPADRSTVLRSNFAAAVATVLDEEGEQSAASLPASAGLPTPTLPRWPLPLHRPSTRRRVDVDNASFSTGS